MTDSYIPIPWGNTTIKPIGSFIASIDFYRLPDGSIRAELRDMPNWLIEAHDTVSDRFNYLADEVAKAPENLRAQGSAFDEQ